MSVDKEITDLELAALVSSRICHDVVGPVGAIFNGLEVLEDDDDEQVKQYAMDVIRRNTKNAWARLEFARLAFGAAGSAGTDIPFNKIQDLANAILEEKHKVEWSSDHDFMPKGYAKLILNLVVVAVAAIPRGGVISFNVSGDVEKPEINISAKGDGARLPERVPTILSGESKEPIDALVIQPYYTYRLLKNGNLSIKLEFNENEVVFSVS
ncbi:histidine phosphotransferase family protein [Hyphomicrobiales bacterium 4NK60-0047b]